MRIAVSFTGGKDSTLVVTAYQLLRTAPDRVPPSLRDRFQAPSSHDRIPEVAVLVTFVPAGGAAFKAHPLPLIQAQAAALQLPHVVKEIAGPDYLAAYSAAIRNLAQEWDLQALATGDILDVCSNFMPRAAQGAGLPLLRPLFDVPRRDMLAALWQLGIRAVVTCVNVHKFAAQSEASATVQPLPTPAAPAEACHGSGAGTDLHFSCAPAGEQPRGTGQQRAIDAVQDLLGYELTPDLHTSIICPAGVDECGEMGEFHTAALAGPTMAHALCITAARLHDPPGAEYAFLQILEPVRKVVTTMDGDAQPALPASPLVCLRDADALDRNTFKVPT